MLSVLGSLGLVASIAGALGLTARGIQVSRRGPGPDVAGPARVSSARTAERSCSIPQRAAPPSSSGSLLPGPSSSVRV